MDVYCCFKSITFHSTEAEDKAYISVGVAGVTTVGHFDGKLYSQRRIHEDTR